MVDANKDNNLEVEARKKELDSLIKKYKNDVNSLVKNITNLPDYQCTNSYNTTSNTSDNNSGKQILCPKELPICSHYKNDKKMGTCMNNEISLEIKSIKESEAQIKEKIDEIHKYNTVNINDYNDNKIENIKTHELLKKNIEKLKESKKQFKKALQYHDDLTGKNSSLKVKIKSNYIKYLLWIVLLVSTIIITLISFIDPKLVPLEIVIIYISFICILSYLTSSYFNLY